MGILRDGAHEFLTRFEQQLLMRDLRWREAHVACEQRQHHEIGDQLESHPNGRDDANWLKHTLWYREGNRLDYKSVKLTPLTVETIALKTRAY